jgi:hypothetical protein
MIGLISVAALGYALWKARTKVAKWYIGILLANILAVFVSLYIGVKTPSEIVLSVYSVMFVVLFVTHWI